MTFNLETATNNTFAQAGRIETLWTDATANSKDSMMRFYTMGPNTSGATPIEHMRLNRGGIALPQDSNLLFNSWYDAGGALRYIVSDSAFGFAHNATTETMEIWGAPPGTGGNTTNSRAAITFDGNSNVVINLPLGSTPNSTTRFHVRNESTAGNAALETLRLQHDDSDSAGSNGIGNYISMTAESNSSGVYPETARIESVLTDAANASKDGDLRFYTLGPNAGAGSNTATEKMRITSAGHIGMGTTTPFTGWNETAVAPGLAMVGTDPIIGLNDTGGERWIVSGRSYGLSITNDTDNLERFVIDNDGEIGIGGTASPAVELDVTGDIQYTGTIADVSDRRLKKDIQNLMSGQLDKVLKLQGVSFKMIEDTAGRTEFGLIAQDVQDIFPELVQESGSGTLSLNYVGLIAPMIEAMKEQQAQIDDLKAMNAALVSRIEKLEAAASGQ